MSKPTKTEISKNVDGYYCVRVLYPFDTWRQVAEVYDRKLASAIVKMLKNGDSFYSIQG
jgi:hypothetical protein